MTEAERRILENQQIMMKCFEVLIEKEMREETAHLPQSIDDMSRFHAAIADLDNKSSLLSNSLKESAALLESEVSVEERRAKIWAENQEKQQAMSDREALIWLDTITDFRQPVNTGTNQVKYAVAFAIAKNALRERVAQVSPSSSADATRVLHGARLTDPFGHKKSMCTRCKAIGNGGNYCSHCGAKMDLVPEDRETVDPIGALHGTGAEDD